MVACLWPSKKDPVMSPPDPHALSLDADGSLIVERFMWSNPKNRMKRARRVLANLQAGDWRCLECGDPVLLHKRADAVYCREACRKRAARRRKAMCCQADRLGRD